VGYSTCFTGGFDGANEFRGVTTVMNEGFDFRAEDFGLVKLPIPVPAMLETALGYPGDERFVAFHECRVSTAGFFVEDSDRKWPGVAAGWSLFCRHPAVARILEALRLDLKRNVPIMSWADWIALPSPQRLEYWSKTRYLVLDRHDRILYIGIYPRVRIFLSMEPASHEPEFDDEDAEITDEDFEASVKSAENEERPIVDSEPTLTATIPLDISRAVLEDLRGWLDEHEPLDDDYTPGAPESCGFRRTYISVEPSQIEDAFDYRGGRRYITLHWSPKAHQVFVCDGIGRWWFSDAVETWNQLLNHPLVKPHLQGWDESEKPGRSVQIDFSAQIDGLPETTLFTSEQSAREMEADVKTNSLLYDRARNDIYTGSWASALLFHSLVEDVLEEDMVQEPHAARSPLLAWLNERQEDPERVFAVAASHHQHNQEQDALAMLRRCIERDPNSHVYWFRLSQTLGSLSRWEEALEACDKAIAFHASAPRQQLTAAYMLKWKGHCLFWLQHYSEAADAYRFAIEIDDFAHKPESYSQLARCYERMGSYREAIGARERQVRDREDSLSEALKCRESEDVEEEIVDSERFFLAEAWLDLGRCYALDGNFGAAEWALRRAIAVSQKCARAHAELGALLRRLGRPEESDCYLRDALALAKAKVEGHPRLGSAHSDLAFVCAALGDSEAADQADQRAAELGWKRNDDEQRVVSKEAADQRSVS
jgi:tetratricopeptide (TPR) repeat protein